MGTFVTKAEKFKNYLSFIPGWSIRRNISYHLQFVEYLYKIRKEESKTTRSLLNKTIIMEFFSISEAIIDSLLCQLEVKTSESKVVSLVISEYVKTCDLLELANKYGIIDSTTKGNLMKMSKTRNYIHIKRPKIDHYEFEFYTDKLLKDNEEIFKEFFEYLFKKYLVKDSQAYPWPWIFR